MNLRTYLMIKQASEAGQLKLLERANKATMKSNLPQNIERVTRGNAARFHINYDPEVTDGSLLNAVNNGVNTGKITSDYDTYNVNTPYSAFMPAAESVGVFGANGRAGMYAHTNGNTKLTNVSQPAAIRRLNK